MPSGLSQLGARVIILAALAVAAGYAPVDLHRVWRDARNGRATPRSDRALAPASSVGIENTDAFAAAGRLLPRDARYLFVTGPDLPADDTASLGYLQSFASYWLLPRRRVADVSEASWVFSYGGRLDSVGVTYRRVLTLAPGIALGEVAR